MNKAERKMILDLCHAFHAGSMAELERKIKGLEERIARPRRSRNEQVARAGRKLARRNMRQESLIEIIGSVKLRAMGKCEVPGCDHDGEEVDHWMGGHGRRRFQESVATLWLLCRAHHEDRTRNWPSAKKWNRRFEEHCQRYGYPFTPHAEHAEVPRG